MTAWWDSLNSLLKALYGIAIFSSVVLLLQTLQLMLGFGDSGEAPDFSDTSGLDLSSSNHTVSGGDVDTDAFSQTHDGSIPTDFDVLRLFSIQTVIAFLTVFSWTSISFITSGMAPLFSMIIGLGFGLAAMFGVAKLIQVSARLVSSGNIVLKNALGQSARVYLPIKAGSMGQGKVMVTLQERMIEQDAITEGDQDLPVGTPVRIVDIRGNVLVVEKE